LLVFYPIVGASVARANVHRYANAWRTKIEEQLTEKLGPITDMGKRVDTVERPYIAYLEKNIVKPLERAVQDDPYDSALRVELAHWYGKLGQIYARTWEKADKNDLETPLYFAARARTVRLSVKSIERNRPRKGETEWAQELDPAGPDAYLAEYRLRLMFAKLWARQAEQEPKAFDHHASNSKREYRGATDAIQKLIQLDPTEPRYHYLLGAVCFQSGDYESCRNAAREADRLNDQANVQRQLADEERKWVKGWTILRVEQLQKTAPPPK
jgi:hypothetical protein